MPSGPQWTVCPLAYPVFAATSSGSIVLTIVGPRRVGLGVDDVDARGAEAGHDQVAPLDMRVRRVRAEHRGAGVPAEVMQLVAGVGHLDFPDELAVGARGGIDVDDGDGVGPVVAGRVDAHDVGQCLGGRLHRRARRGVKGRDRVARWAWCSSS